jgi:hypothetical protein
MERITMTGRVLPYFASLALLQIGGLAYAQTPPPVDEFPLRGVLPTISYALSDIETINTANGNVMMKIPLANLPPGRGGLGFGLNLV